LCNLISLAKIVRKPNYERCQQQSLHGWQLTLTETLRRVLLSYQKQNKIQLYLANALKLVDDKDGLFITPCKTAYGSLARYFYNSRLLVDKWFICVFTLGLALLSFFIDVGVSIYIFKFFEVWKWLSLKFLLKVDRLGLSLGSGSPLTGLGNSWTHRGRLLFDEILRLVREEFIKLVFVIDNVGSAM
jgi:hypothetical protein